MEIKIYEPIMADVGQGWQPMRVEELPGGVYSLVAKVLRGPKLDYTYPNILRHTCRPCSWQDVADWKPQEAAVRTPLDIANAYADKIDLYKRHCPDCPALETCDRRFSCRENLTTWADRQPQPIQPELTSAREAAWNESGLLQAVGSHKKSFEIGYDAGHASRDNPWEVALKFLAGKSPCFECPAKMPQSACEDSDDVKRLQECVIHQFNHANAQEAAQDGGEHNGK